MRANPRNFLRKLMNGKSRSNAQEKKRDAIVDIHVRCVLTYYQFLSCSPNYRVPPCSAINYPIDSVSRLGLLQLSLSVLTGSKSKSIAWSEVSWSRVLQGTGPPRFLGPPELGSSTQRQKSETPDMSSNWGSIRKNETILWLSSVS